MTESKGKIRRKTGRNSFHIHTFYARIKAYMVKAHIPVSGKRRGMHSLRHTMASVLLEKDTPLPVISDIIGHLDTNSTAVYLKVDMARLAECPLDFEEVIRLG